VFPECRLDGRASPSLEDSGEGSELANSVPPELPSNSAGLHFQFEGPGKKTSKTDNGFSVKKNRAYASRNSDEKPMEMIYWSAQLKEMEAALVV